MFKLFVFFALVAIAFAAPKAEPNPQLFYGAGFGAGLGYGGAYAPVAYSGSYGYGAYPYAYSGLGGYGSYAV